MSLLLSHFYLSCNEPWNKHNESCLNNIFTLTLYYVFEYVLRSKKFTTSDVSLPIVPIAWNCRACPFTAKNGLWPFFFLLANNSHLLWWNRNCFHFFLPKKNTLVKILMSDILASCTYLLTYEVIQKLYESPNHLLYNNLSKSLHPPPLALNYTHIYTQTQIPSN